MERIIPKFDNPDSVDQSIVPDRHQILENMEPTLDKYEHLVQTVAKTKTAPVVSLSAKEETSKMYAMLRLHMEMLCESYRQPRIIGEDGLGKEVFKSAEMKLITENFIKENFIGHTHFEKLYRGKLQDKVVVVKISNLKRNLSSTNIDWILRIIDEIKFLEHSTIKGHPNLVNIIGYSEEDTQMMGVVYDLDPLDTLSNLISKGSLNWNQTIQIALELAQLIAWLHSDGYLVRNLAPGHILIDKEFKPRLVDFLMLTGGIMGDRVSDEQGRFPYPAGYNGQGGLFDKRYDVYVYGKILVNLIHKKVYDNDKDIPYCDQFQADLWAEEEYNNRGVRSFVHESLQMEIDDWTEKKVTKLAMDCFVITGDNCLTMKQVVATLLEIKSHVN